MIQIFVAYATEKRQIEIPLQVEENCNVALAIRRSGILQLFPEIVLAKSAVGIYGRRTTLDAALRDNDRVEIYRPLQIEPKQARVLRAKQQISNKKKT